MGWELDVYLHLLQANQKFHSSSQVAHGCLLRYLLPADPDSTVGRVAAGQNSALLNSQLSMNAAWFKPPRSQRTGTRLSGHPAPMAAPERKRRAAVPPASPSLLRLELVIQLRNSLMQTLITLILIQSKLPTPGFVRRMFLFHHPAGCDYIEERMSRRKQSQACSSHCRRKGANALEAAPLSSCTLVTASPDINPICRRGTTEKKTI